MGKKVLPVYPVYASHNVIYICQISPQLQMFQTEKWTILLEIMAKEIELLPEYLFWSSDFHSTLFLYICHLMLLSM